MADHEPSPSGSSPSQEPLDSLPLKRRRLHGACDACKKKKIKCDSAEMAGNICSNCLSSRITCTHETPRQPKKKETQQAYIQSLEDRLQRLERALERQHGDPLSDPETHDPVSGADVAAKNTQKDAGSSLNAELKATLLSPPGSDNFHPDIRSSDSSDGEDLAHVELTKELKKLSLAPGHRFFGHASAFMLAQHAASVRSEVTGDDRPLGHSFRRPQFWDFRPLNHPRYVRQWEREAIEGSSPPYVYPEPDLLEKLVDLYFDRSNKYLPLLHRPTFLRMLAAGQHHWDSQFGMVVLMVCAVGSRYIHDPRVLMPGDPSEGSSGWAYFSQVPIFRNTLIGDTTIFDLQYYALAVLYVLGSSVPHLSWNLLGLAMRLAIEKGAHRRGSPNDKPTVENELWKRAFWTFIAMDRLMSAFVGRPSSIQFEDFDAEYPVDCDDEYWETENPEQAFKQPPGKPSLISGFIHQLQLSDILAFTHRTLYSIKKSKTMLGLVGDDWEHRTVAQIDSALNKWKDSTPSHLRWDPNMKDPNFFAQAAGLSIYYHYVQIQVHRPFLTKDSTLRFPSLAICTHAARSLAHVLEAGSTRAIPVFPLTMMSAFASGIVLLISAWGKRSAPHGKGTTDLGQAELQCVRKCLDVLKECEVKWHVAGRFRDMLNELGSFTEHHASGVQKRRREETNPSDDPQRPPHLLGTSGIPSVAPPFSNILSSGLGALDPPYRPVPQQPTAPLATSATNQLGDNAGPRVSFNQLGLGDDWDLNALLIEMGHANWPSETQGIPPTTTTTAVPGALGPGGVSATGPVGPTNYNTSPSLNTNAGLSGGAYSPPSISNRQGGSPSTFPSNSPRLFPAEAPQNDMISVWSEAPTAFGLEEWNNYLQNTLF